MMITSPTNTHEGLTPAAAWRQARESGVKFHFPSGFEAKVRTVNTATFIRLGKIPDLLTPLVQKAISGEAALASLSLDEMVKLGDVYDIFCQTTFVWPRIVEEVKDPDNEITLEDISDTDKVTLFQFMGSPASVLADFRPIQTQPLDGVVGQPIHPAESK